MELYHKTIVDSSSVLLAIVGSFTHHTATETQLVLAKCNSIELYEVSEKLTLLDHCPLYSNICNVVKFDTTHLKDNPSFKNKDNTDASINHAPQSTIQHGLILTLENGSYLILSHNGSKWEQIQTDEVFLNKRFAGICKPITGIDIMNIGLHLAVCNKFVCLAGVCGQLVVKQLVSKGLKQFLMTNDHHYLMHIEPMANSFILLEVVLKDEIICKRVRKVELHPQILASSIIEEVDASAHKLIPLNDTLYLVASEGKLSAKEITASFPPFATTLQTINHCKRQKDLLLLTENGFVFEVNFQIEKYKVTKINIQYIAKVEPSLQLIRLWGNTYFSVSQHHNHALLCLKNTPSQSNDLSNTFETKDSLTQCGVMTDMRLLRSSPSMNDVLVSTAQHGQGTLTLFKYGLRATEVQSIPYHHPPTALWCVRQHKTEKYHSFIVLSLSKRSIRLQIEHHSLTPESDVGIDCDDRTIAFDSLHNDSFVQVQPNKIRHIGPNCKEFTDIPLANKALASAIAKSQIAVSLSGGYLLYFELDKSHSLVEIEQRLLASEVCCIAFSRQLHFSNSLIVAQNNYSVTVFALNCADKVMQEMCNYSLKTAIESIVMGPFQQNCNILNVGLSNGCFVQLAIQSYKIQGKNSEKIHEIMRKQTEGRPLKIAKIAVNGGEGILKMHQKISLQYELAGKITEGILSLSPFDIASSIDIPDHQNTFITYFDSCIRIIELSGFKELFHRETVILPRSARKIISFENCIGVLQYDLVQDGWVTQFEVISETDLRKKIRVLHFGEDQKCISVCYVKPRKSKVAYLCFGCVTGLRYHPYKVVNQYIRVYEWSNTEVTELYKFQLQGTPLVIQDFNDKLLVGVGTSLRLYEIGKSKLLLKAQRRHFASNINGIHTDGEKIFVTQMMESFNLLRRNKHTHSFDLVTDDVLPRYVVTGCLLDTEGGVVAGADKFGNLFVSKMSARVKEEFYSRTEPINEFINAHKFQSLVSYYVGEIVTKIILGKIDAHKRQVIFYCTISGGIGVLCPFDSEEEHSHNILSKLQNCIRKSKQIVAVDSHHYFRSHYNPVKGVIDGDLCERFLQLSTPQQKFIAQCMKLPLQKIEETLQKIKKPFLCS